MIRPYIELKMARHAAPPPLPASGARERRGTGSSRREPVPTAYARKPIRFGLGGDVMSRRMASKTTLN